MKKTKKALDRYSIETLDLESLEPSVSATILLEFLRELPEPLISTQYKLFLNVLKNPNESNQINDLKLLVKQLPNPNKGTLIHVLYILSIIDLNNGHNKTSKQMLARTFAEYIIWDPVHGGFGQARDSQERAKLMKLMIDHHSILADAVKAHTSLSSRASRAGIVPDPVRAGVSTPEPGGHEGRNSRAASAEADSAGSLPMVMDEGMAIVKQLGDSNDALQVLVEHLGTALDSVQAVQRDVAELASRVEEVEVSHNSLYHEVEGKADKAAPGRDADADAGSALEARLEVWMGAVAARLDALEARPEQAAGKAMAQMRPSGETSARDDVSQWQERLEEFGTEFVAWKAEFGAELETWKVTTMCDAAQARHLAAPRSARR